MAKESHTKYNRNNKGLRKNIRNKWVMHGKDPNEIKYFKLSERSMSQYFYQKPTHAELKDFVIKHQAGTNKLKKLFLKIKIALTHNKYFESLFPTIKEQKPGYDLYAPMVAFQVLIITFMIFFYTRMDPDYANVTTGDLAPTTFNQTMVLAVFLQIIIIVLDRYLYLSRDYVVIDGVEIEEDLYNSDEDIDNERTESISQFDRKMTFNLRSSSASKLMIKGMKHGEFKLKGEVRNFQNLDEVEDFEPEDDIEEERIQLSKIKSNKTLHLKYYLQFTLLIIIHIVVFWYLPIKTNVNSQSTPF